MLYVVHVRLTVHRTLTYNTITDVKIECNRKMITEIAYRNMKELPYLEFVINSLDTNANTLSS